MGYIITARGKHKHSWQPSPDESSVFLPQQFQKLPTFSPFPLPSLQVPERQPHPNSFCMWMCWQLVTSSPLGERGDSKLGRGGLKSLKCVHIHNWVSEKKESTQDFGVASLRANTNNIQDEGTQKACKQITGKVAVTLRFWDWLKKELVSSWYYEALAVTHHRGACVICFSVGPNNTVIFCLSSPLNKGSQKHKGGRGVRIRQDARRTE